MRRAWRWFDNLRGRLGLPWLDVALAVAIVVITVFWVSEFTEAGDLPAEVFLSDRQDPGPHGPPAPPAQPRQGDEHAPRFGPEPDYFDDTDDEDPVAAVNLVAAFAVAFRRRFPLSAFAVAGGALFLIQDGLVWPGFVAILICAYSAVAYGRSVAFAFTMLVVAALVAASLFNRTIPDMPGWLGPFLVLLPAGLGAVALRNARGRADAAARRAAALEAEQEAAARAAIAEERARIARELHDIVSHHVSVMVIQAGAAGKVIESQPVLAQNALGAIESSGREAMAELRHLLGLLAPADDRLHPQPGLAELDTLVEKVRAAGQPVNVHREPADLAPGVDLTAYRVIQEGLTNALRYAPGAQTTVQIRRDGEVLAIEVANAAGAREPLTGGAYRKGGAGRGLIGLGERVKLLDGQLDARPSAGGGFRLTARIPLREDKS